jgi:hypothetical protein
MSLINKKVFIHPNRFSSNRTKNRIKEHGEKGFLVINHSNSLKIFDGREAILLSSFTKNASNGQGSRESWVGWMPIDEITLTLKDGDE